MKKDSIRISALGMTLNGKALAYDITKDDIGKAIKAKLKL